MPMASFSYFFLGTGGFKDGVLPGVLLLSRCLRSGFPVDSAILLGPGLSVMILRFNWLYIKGIKKYSLFK
jgi:hypothetical protein